MRYKFIILFIILGQNLIWGQYTNENLSGPWLLVLSDQTDLYIILDGNGVIEEGGYFGLPMPGGDYSVESNGTFTGQLISDGFLPFFGQILTDSTAEMRIDEEGDTLRIPMFKITDPSLAAGPWSGLFTLDSAAGERQIQINVDSEGKIDTLIGLLPPFKGHIYFQSGHLAGHIMTGETDEWFQISFSSGTLGPDSMRGTFDLDCGECPGGQFSLVNEPLSVKNTKNEGPVSFTLNQNYPNPFNPSTTIEFTLPKSEFTTLKVFNTLGKEVATIVSGKLNQGNHTYRFDGKNLASGIYYYQLVAGEYREVKKMILLR